MASPGHESETHGWIDENLLSGGLIDVGSCCGAFSLRHAQFDTIIAIEPSGENFGALQRNVTLNGRSATLVHAAAGASPGRIRLFLTASDTHSTIGSGRYEEVAAVTVDQIWRDAGRPRISLLKIDVEGAEPDVIRGAGELLETGPFVIAEANTETARTILTDALRANGFQLLKRLDSANYLFEPSESAGTSNPLILQES